MNPDVTTLIMILRRDDPSPKRCLMSIAEQTWRPLQCVVVEADGTVETEIALRLRQAGVRLELVTAQGSLSRWQCMRLGVSHAGGGSVMFLHPEEWLDKEAVATLRELMQHTGADAVQMRERLRLRNMVLKTDHKDYPDGIRLDGADYRRATSPVNPDGRILSDSVTDKLYRLDMLREALSPDYGGRWGTREILNLHYFRHARSIAFTNYAGVNRDWAHRSVYRYSRLADIKRVYAIKRLVCGDSDMLRGQLRDSLLEHVRHLVGELGWTREAVAHYMARELSDRFWHNAGLDVDAGVLVSEASRETRRRGLSATIKRMFS